jgi:hypothetical protein
MAGPDLLATRLVEMMVVDRSLKPHYILESAACLHRLTIDWQVPTASCPFYQCWEFGAESVCFLASRIRILLREGEYVS